MPRANVRENVSLVPYTTLMAGGAAQWLVEARGIDDFAEIAATAQVLGIPHFIIGSGSNILPSDRGVRGLVIINYSSVINLSKMYAECGCWFQDLFLATTQAGFGGMEFAVGIPGTLGGALVSNAGAYRANIADRLEAVEIVRDSERQWVEPSYLDFRYRDSVLRRANPPPIALLAVKMKLERDQPKHIYDLARDYQRQRISKQPPHPSAGSFFKNVESRRLGESLPDLPDKLRLAGVVPAGFLIEACGLKGLRQGRAKISEMHANFICNLGGATASDIRTLAETAAGAVKERFGVSLEEEVLYVGDWE